MFVDQRALAVYGSSVVVVVVVVVVVAFGVFFSKVSSTPNMPHFLLLMFDV